MTDSIKAKKWISLGIIATALLLVPRRSSRKTDINPHNNKNTKPDSNVSSIQNANNCR
jgi:hypothetical protein